MLLPTSKVTLGPFNDLTPRLSPTVFAPQPSYHHTPIFMAEYPSIQVSPHPHHVRPRSNTSLMLECQGLISVHMRGEQKTALVYSTLFLRQGFSVATDAQLAGQQGPGILLSVSSSPEVRLQTHIQTYITNTHHHHHVPEFLRGF